jgi:predicted RecB family nuclease
MGAKLTGRTQRSTPAERIKKIQSRLWDLFPVVRNHVYHPKFAGSFSLKAVLPALVPEMTVEARGYAANSKGLQAAHSEGENHQISAHSFDTNSALP